MAFLTKDKLSNIAPHLKEPKLSLYLDLLNQTISLYNINTLTEVAMFIAQVMHESMECVYTKELASGEAYEGRKDLGNTSKGDGVRYKGRGLIQITGKDNYKKLSDAFNVDFVKNPELLEQPEWATKSAGWFWDAHGLSKIADGGDEAAFELVTRRINGGLNGLQDRKDHWIRAKKEFGI